MYSTQFKQKRESISLQEIVSFVAQKNGCYPRRISRGYAVRCTAHDDKKASLSVSTGDDGRILMRCHAGCTIDEICSSLDIAVSSLFPQNDKGYRRGK